MNIQHSAFESIWEKFSNDTDVVEIQMAHMTSHSEAFEGHSIHIQLLPFTILVRMSFVIQFNFPLK